MGNITVATDIGGVFREVSTFPTGTASDGGITGVQINGKKGVRTRKGVHTTDEVGVFANGLDQTSRLNTVLAHAKVKVLDIHAEGGGTIVINGAVTVPAGKILRFTEGTYLGGSGSITNFKLSADVTTQCVADTATLTFTPASFSGPYICPVWWGFKPGTSDDMSPFLQKAVTLACENEKTKIVYIATGGNYKVKDVVVMRNIGSANPGQTSCSILGVAQSSGQGVIFQTTDPNAACLHFQTVLGCNVERITFDGPIPVYVSNPITYYWGTGMRDNAITPSAAIAIDDLYRGPQSLITDANRYPGVPVAAYNCTQYAGSTNVKFVDCNWYNWYIAIASNLSNCPNGEGLRVTGGNSHNVGYFWAAGSLQTREAVIDNHYFFNGRTFISNLGWGSGLGDVPTVINCNINQVKYLFQLSGSDFSFARFSHCYGEGIWSLGYSSSQLSVTMLQCQFTQTVPDQYGGFTAPSPIYVETGGPFLFQGGKLEMIGYYCAPIPIKCKSAAFRDMFVRGGVIYQADTRFMDLVVFENVHYATAGGGGVTLSDNYSNDQQDQAGADEAYYLGKIFLPGNSMYTRQHRKLVGTGQKIERIPVGSYVVTVNGPARTATFTPDNTGRFQQYDTLHVDETSDLSSAGFSNTQTGIGYVANVSGGVVNVAYVPMGVVSGTYTIFVLRYPRFAGRGLGATINGQATITGVVSDTGGVTLSGTRLKGQGIPAGAYVTGFNSTTKVLTMSMPCTATNAKVELCDAPYKALADTKPFVFFGATVSVLDIAIIWFKGDEVMNVTPDFRSTSFLYRSLYCLGGGKMSDTTYPPYFFSEKPSMDMQLFGNSNVLQLNNIYWDGTVWRYKATDAAGATALQFYNGDLNFFSFNGGIENAVATLVLKFSVLADGTVVAVNSIKGITEPLSENSIKMATTAWVRGYTAITYARLAGAYQIITAQTQINSVIVQQLKGNGPIPTFTLGTGAGTGASANIYLGHSFSFKFELTTGSAPAAAGSVVATITLAEAVGGDNPLINYAARNSGAALAPFYFETNSHQNVVVKCAAALAASTNYDLNITVIDY